MMARRNSFDLILIAIAIWAGYMYMGRVGWDLFVTVMYRTIFTVVGIAIVIEIIEGRTRFFG